MVEIITFTKITCCYVGEISEVDLLYIYTCR